MDRVLSTTEVNYLRRTAPSQDDEAPTPSFRYVLSYDLSGDQVGIDSDRGDEGTEGNPIDLISSDGRYLGTFAPGSTAMPSAFGPNGLAAFVETDDLDVPYVGEASAGGDALIRGCPP